MTDPAATQAQSQSQGQATIRYANATTAAQSAGYAAVLAGFVSLGVARIMLSFVEQTELLTAFAALGAAVMVGARRLYEEWALRDQKIDRLEAFHLDVASLVKLILFFCAGQFVILIATSLFLLEGQETACVVLMLFLLVALALSFIPFVTDTILITPLSRVDALRSS